VDKNTAVVKGAWADANIHREEFTISAHFAASSRIWIDLDNTPHVPFFLPIIRALEKEGHSVIVTARDAFQVCSLAAYHGLKFRTIGRHYGANRVMKVGGTLWRATQLIPILLRERPNIAMSHGSRALELVSFVLRIPSMLIFDYEHAMRLPFVRPALGVAPDSIHDPELAKEFRHGLRTYEGLKEDVYAAGFTPDPTILSELGIAGSEILVTIRPPATEAHYHNPEAERLFVEAVNFLASNAGVRMVILPRTASSQGEFIRRTWSQLCEERRIIVPDRALGGLNLVWFSDLVVSGGGTMNREAAALGVPVYSIFRGALGAVDRQLAREGRLTMIETVEEIRLKLRIAKRVRTTEPLAIERPALRQILNAAHELLELAKDR
jgi:predicted glycosyltransferase